MTVAPPDRRLVQVAAGVIASGSQVLVCQRPAGGHHPFKWEFPGGKAEAGERLDEALRRELREELAIDAVIGRVLWQTRHQYAHRDPLALTFFAVPRYSGVLTNCGFAAMRWVGVEALDAVDFLEGDRAFVAQLRVRSVAF